MILWKNGYFHTLVDDKQVYHHMVTDNGLIVGFDDEIKGLSFDQENDLNALHVYPGFVDAHLHLIGYGQKLGLISLEGSKSKSETLDIIKKHVKEGTIFFEGYKPNGVDKFDLNQISDNTPLILRHSDYHSVTVNDFVLKKQLVMYFHQKKINIGDVKMRGDCGLLFYVWLQGLTMSITERSSINSKLYV